VYTIRIVGPMTVRDWSAAKLSKARAHNGEWRDVWTGAAADGVTLMEAVARLRALRDALQEDADAYRRGL
jgi:ABC-type transporter lipoprotein component MlaA